MSTQCQKTIHFRYFRWVIGDALPMGCPLSRWHQRLQRVCLVPLGWHTVPDHCQPDVASCYPMVPNGSDGIMFGKKVGEDSWTEIGIWYLHIILYIHIYILIYIYIHILTYVYHNIAFSGCGCLQGSLFFSGNKIKNNGKSSKQLKQPRLYPACIDG